jgi:hypothetical protein
LDWLLKSQSPPDPLSCILNTGPITFAFKLRPFFEHIPIY